MKGKKNKEIRFFIGLIRAFAGAILFSFPMLMTMEMWHLGFYMDPLRLAIFILISIPLLARLNYFAGFETDTGLFANLLDAFSVYFVAVLVSFIVLSLFEIISPGMAVSEIVGKIAIQSVPASIGAMLSRSQLGENDVREERRKSAGYGAGIFMATIGALYLSLSLAATEEMILISYKMSPLFMLGLVILSLTMMHGFLFEIARKDKSPLTADQLPFWKLLIRFTIPGYVFALLISLYILWSFGRTDGTSIQAIVEATIVLGFPASLGAGAARLIL